MSKILSEYLISRDNPPSWFREPDVEPQSGNIPLQNVVIDISEEVINDNNQTVQQQLECERTNLAILEEREISINRLSSDVVAVSDLFSDLSLLVSQQGESFDNIETNIVDSQHNIERANKQLIKANNYQNNNRRCLCTCVFSVLTIILFLITILMINSN